MRVFDKYIFEEFNSINLNIPLRGQTLVELFKDYLKKETNDDDDNLYYCEKCKKNTISLKKVSLNILPETLIVVLKRYSCTGTKILSEIEYPEKLSIKESSSSVIKNYQLNCIVNHVGNLFDGHYTTSTLIKNNWYYLEYEGDLNTKPQEEESITDVQWIKKEAFDKCLNQTYPSIQEVIDHAFES